MIIFNGTDTIENSLLDWQDISLNLTECLANSRYHCECYLLIDKVNAIPHPCYSGTIFKML